MAKPDSRDRGYAPRGLRREAAAAYIGLGTTKFDELVADGRLPGPKRIDGCVIWDRCQLDAAFDELGNDAPSGRRGGVSFDELIPGNPWDRFR
jgi:predicted DNA-binding transcriptional regulator AlpA